MEKEFVPYELALALKELGFDEPCVAKYAIYNPGNEMNLFPQNQNFFKGGFEFFKNSHNDTKIAAPLYQQAFRWFREKGIESEIRTDFDRMLGYNRGYIPIVQFIEFYNNGDCYETYEEAELECLKKLIEIVKEK